MMYPSITTTTQIEYKKEDGKQKSSKEQGRKITEDTKTTITRLAPSLYIYTVHDGEDKAGTNGCRGGGRGSGR